MTQNIYDDEAFFAAYGRLPRSVEGLAGAPEWPALRALLPDLAGRRVLDLGCGYGWFCRWAREHGAASVLGLDVSARMLARARAETEDAAIVYAEADLEHFAALAEPVDVAFSSLAFHYVVNLAGLFAGLHASLAPGGALVFSVEHPIYTAPRNPGWSDAADGQAAWPVDSYLDEGPRTTNWLVDGVIKQHRTIGRHVSLLVRSGFAVTHLDEWGPSAEQIAAHPDWANERQRPSFLIMGCERR